MPVTLSDAEQKILAAVISQLDTIPAVNFQKVGDEVGIKYGNNARKSFRKIWEKLKGGAPGPKSPSRSPIKKSNAPRVVHRSPEPPHVRPSRQRKKPEKAIESEKFQQDYPSDEDEEMIEKKEDMDDRILYNGTPESVPDTQRDEEGDEYNEDPDETEDDMNEKEI